MDKFQASSAAAKGALTQNGRVFVFLRPWTPVALGHVGWGFQIGPDLYGFGATENTGADHWLWLSPAIIAKGDRNDWWGLTGTFKEMKAEIKRMTYSEYAAVRAARCSPKAAVGAALATKQAGYGLAGNNCLDHVYEILKAYSAGVHQPKAGEHWAPRNWFSALGWKDWGKVENMRA